MRCCLLIHHLCAHSRTHPGARWFRDALNGQKYANTWASQPCMDLPKRLSQYRKPIITITGTQRSFPNLFQHGKTPGHTFRVLGMSSRIDSDDTEFSLISYGARQPDGKAFQPPLLIPFAHAQLCLKVLYGASGPQHSERTRSFITQKDMLRYRDQHRTQRSPEKL